MRMHEGGSEKISVCARRANAHTRAEMRTRACSQPLCVLASWAALLACARANNACPPACACSQDSGTVSCHAGGASGVPTRVPAWTSTLILRGRNVTTLQRGAFAAPNGSALDEAATLSLSGNLIRAVEADAFAGLPHLHVLDLSHNQLERVSDGAFKGLRELRTLCLNESIVPEAAAQLAAALGAGDLRDLHRLELAGNRLRSPPLTPAGLDAFQLLHQLVLVNNSIRSLGREDVGGLERQRRTRVYLARNPFRCACELEALYWWLKNASQCPDAALLRCAEPEARRGLQVEQLRPEDVDCLNENLEAVSYVFLGIVLALIGLVFLMVLYLNRGGIKRWLNNIREACRDQMEVYHYRYEQDSDPRLANVAV
ncbi:wnt-activated inhibitory factor 2 [Syngnathus acus]|uniref:wnt-activated inhibitory factor 2 n=1 Tax=Syngnathus acus TaxID=161584 RepID=UPI001885CC02|nr:wnt-activated inhibitory factor 2 [Syngnathus acus]